MLLLLFFERLVCGAVCDLLGLVVDQDRSVVFDRTMCLNNEAIDRSEDQELSRDSWHLERFIVETSWELRHDVATITRNAQC